MGRLTKDPELRYTTSNLSVCSFIIAVDRRYKSEGQPTVDFIPVIAWRQTAEFVAKYFTKGQRIALTGSIQTRNREDENGKKYYVTEILANDVYFCESKKQQDDGGKYATSEAGYNDGFYPLEDNDIPF